MIGHRHGPQYGQDLSTARGDLCARGASASLRNIRENQHDHRQQHRHASGLREEQHQALQHVPQVLVHSTRQQRTKVLVVVVRVRLLVVAFDGFVMHLFVTSKSKFNTQLERSFGC
eukprot:8699021-Pyramimonas_sp.AAC.1